MKLSICMMVKNEEKNLSRCLESLNKLRNSIDSELIIVDTGSTDGTIGIANRYTDKVYYHPWNNDFSAMRNITVSYAKGEWVLIIDADEELEDAKELIRFFKSPENIKYSSVGFTVKNLISENDKEKFNAATIVRLYKNVPELKFRGKIHEEPRMDGKSLFLKNTSFYHYGYKQDDKELQSNKYNRNIELLKMQVKEEPDNIAYRFYLAIQLLSGSEKEEALEQAKTAYELARKTNQQTKYAIFYSTLVFCYIENKLFSETLKICVEGIKLVPEHIDLYYCAGKASYLLGNYEDCIRYYSKYFELIENYENLSIRYNGMCNFLMLDKILEANNEMAICYIKLGRYDDAADAVLLKKNSFRDNKELVEYMLTTMPQNESSYERLLNYYVDSGIEFIKSKYETEILNSNSYSEMIEKEDLFFAYMYDFQKEKDAQLKIELLRKAIQIRPEMKNGIKMLLDKFIKEQQDISINKQINEYKKQLKLAIRQLIEAKRNSEAEVLIQEFEKMIKGDAEISELKKMLNLNKQ